MGLPLAGVHSKTRVVEATYDIAIIGGGPAGSTLALYLARIGFQVCLVEKRIFPRETLCGEFLSREVIRILEDLQLTNEFLSHKPNPITSFRFCPEDSQTISTNLKFTAYGLKRGAFDAMLLNQARCAGATVYQPMTASEIKRIENGYSVFLTGAEGNVCVGCKFVVCAYGKSNALDKTLGRHTANSKTGMVGVKYHIPQKYFRTLPDHEIRIYSGHNMYCGVSNVNDATVTLCFLKERSASDSHPREQVASLRETNRHFYELISADIIEMLPSFPIYGTSDVYFGTKKLVFNGMFMIGDAAQVIAPLAGDGIGIAMENAHMLASLLDEHRKNNWSAQNLENMYTERWRSSFHKRLITARRIQKVLFSEQGKKISGVVLSMFPSLLHYFIEHTRG